MRNFSQLMLSALLFLAGTAALAGDVSLPAPGAHLDGLTPAPVTVMEPHESKPFKPVEITYKGYPAVPVLDHLLGTGWRAPETLVAFEAKDGYLSMIPSSQFLRYPGYLVYANAQGNDFSIETPPLNERVALGPWYLIWDNILQPDLQADGATYWPYQVTRISLVDKARLARLMPPMLPERYQEGGQLTLKYCLSCHQVNGVGGTKMPIDLGQWAAGQSYARFATWVLDPSGKNPLTAMPPLAPERPAADRQRLARQIYGYLRAVGALGK